MARPGVAAVEDVLHSEVDVDALRLACDLDAVTKGRRSTVCPARPTVLRDVLVQVLCQVAHTVHVTPGEVRRQVCGLHVRVRECAHDMGLDTRSSLLLTCPHEGLLLRRHGGGAQQEHCGGLHCLVCCVRLGVYVCMWVSWGVGGVRQFWAQRETG